MEILSVPEVAEELNISRAAVYYAADDGRLTPLRDRPLIFTREAVNQYAENMGIRNGYRKRDRRELATAQV